MDGNADGGDQPGGAGVERHQGGLEGSDAAPMHSPIGGAVSRSTRHPRPTLREAVGNPPARTETASAGPQVEVTRGDLHENTIPTGRTPRRGHLRGDGHVLQRLHRPPRLPTPDRRAPGPGRGERPAWRHRARCRLRNRQELHPADRARLEGDGLRHLRPDGRTGAPRPAARSGSRSPTPAIANNAAPPRYSS